ncbi:MAG TPA: hypothetical protein VM553_12990 [Dongiaceae bacterium]|nr:hypothetical protein [Dongiaceae bacterium]
MNRFMSRLFALCFLFASVFTLSSAWADAPSIEIISDSAQKWDFRQVVATQTDQGWVVSGRLNHRMDVGLPAGHVDFAAYGPDGRLLAEATTHYSPSQLTPKSRKKGGVRFSVVVAQSLPDGARVRVAFHPEPVQSESPTPSHSVNVSR